MTNELPVVDHAGCDESFKVTKEWVCAGKAIFTVHSASGEHYTYRVSRVDNKGRGYPPAWFVSVLTGQDNENDYTYVGKLRTNSGYTELTRASKFADDSKIVKVIRWALKIVWTDGAEFPAGYGCNGEGRCGRCGRTLTRPEGVDPAGYRFGYGPECFRIINGE